MPEMDSLQILRGMDIPVNPCTSQKTLTFAFSYPKSSLFDFCPELPYHGNDGIFGYNHL
jgi:hypothetical protein